MVAPFTLANPLLRGLACAALEPELRRVLLFDASFETLEMVVPLFQAMLQTTTGAKVKVVNLAVTALDDALWGSLTPDLPEANSESPLPTGLAVRWQDGLLTQNRALADWLLVVIPDLTRLSLAAARTCIMLLDTPVAHLQRHGQDAVWQPRICWLAACDRERVGRVSPHLLDRFALRLTPSEDNPGRKPADILAWLQEAPQFLPELGEIGSNELPQDIIKALQTAMKQRVAMTDTAVARVLAYLSPQTSGIRRELTLARLSLAQAGLAAAKEVQAVHVSTAAKLIGLRLPDSNPDSLMTTSSAPKGKFQTPQESADMDNSADNQQTNPRQSSSDDSSPVYDSGEPDIQKDSTPLPVTPYPEDTSATERELFALQLPLRRFATRSAEHGVVIGNQPTNSLHDLALLPTILEAALYQRVRQPEGKKGNGRLSIYPSDLRRHRRIPGAEQMLLILLDYTSLRDCQWQEALLPHLRWAYVMRASVGIVQVGVAEAIDELRAQKVTANSILTPRIGQALVASPGRATPLAHGLELAYQMLQQAQEHGRHLVQHTRFVIITDGRGNVPLDASHRGEIQRPVRREGIEDALKVAREFHDLRRVLPILLDPQPIYHAELPVELAVALAAVHEKIPLVEEAQLR
jgi:magnesium chelatase subunit D